MPQFATSLRWGSLMVLLLISAGLACNAPSNRATEPPTATITASPTIEQVQSTLGAPETLPAIPSPATSRGNNPTPLPVSRPFNHQRWHNACRPEYAN